MKRSSASFHDLADDLVRSRHELGRCAIWQAGPPADLQRSGHSDMSDDEGPFWHGVAADDRVWREPPAAGGAGLAGARLQHAVASPEDLGREHPLPGLQRSAASSDPSCLMHSPAPGVFWERPRGLRMFARWRGMDRTPLGRKGPFPSRVAPAFSSDLNGYQGARPA